jgi:hypothetical protein
MRRHLRYAARQSRPHADRWWFAPFGGLLAACLLYGVGVPASLSHWLPDHALLRNAFDVVVCIVVAYVLMFFGWVCWSPIHERVEPHGGLRSALRKKLGAQMWPAMLMFFGLMLFGVGTLLFVIKAPALQSSVLSPRCKAANSAYNVSHKLEIIDKIYAELTGPVTEVQNRAGLLMNSFNQKLHEKTATSELEGLAQQAKPVFERFDRVIFGYDYLQDIHQIMIQNSDSYRSLETSTRRLEQEIENMYATNTPEHAFTIIQNSVFLARWRSSVEETARWINEKKYALRTKRREYESLDVCVS